MLLLFFTNCQNCINAAMPVKTIDIICYEDVRVLTLALSSVCVQPHRDANVAATFLCLAAKIYFS